MKKIILVRHSKSSWKDFSLADFQRPLNKRGRFDGPIMANYLVNKTKAIDYLHSSSSVRTFETSKFFISRIKFKEIKYDDDLYHCPADSIVDILKNYIEDYDSVMIVSHNPGLTDLINNITNISLDNLPTSGIAEIHFNCDCWSKISVENSSLIDLKFPKQLK